MAKKKLSTKEVQEMSASERDAEKPEVLDCPYTQEELEDRAYRFRLLEEARNNRETSKVEFNGLTFTENYISNQKAANSFAPPLQNEDDTQIVTGTTREKVLAIVSSILNLKFSTVFKPHDENDMEDVELGEDMTDCVDKSKKIEQWEDKELPVYYELASQGDVYIQDLFVYETAPKKKAIPLNELNERIIKNYKPVVSQEVVFTGYKRVMIEGTQVYKGSMKIRSLSEQPFIFTRMVLPYQTTKSIYGGLPRFKYVPQTRVDTVTTANDEYGTNWRLESTVDGECEIIIFQRKTDKTFQLTINGVDMCPVGFPFPWNHGEYSIVQGSLEPISAFFSESKSIPSKNKTDQEVLDEMVRLAVLKGQKSYMPPIANYSGQLLSREMFRAGKVTNDLAKGDIEVLGGDPNAYTLKQSEFEMINMLKKFIDEKSIDPIMQGVNPSAEVTATQVNAVTAQAKQKLGLMIFGFMRLHYQLDYLRLLNLLDCYTEPVDTKIDNVKKKLINKYRSVTVDKDLGSLGMGTKNIEFTESPQTPLEIYDKENGITRDESGRPISVNPPKRPLKIRQLDPKALREVKYRWYGDVITEPRENTLADRIDYEDRLSKGIALFGRENINMDYAKMQWAQKNKIRGDLFFNKTPTPLPQSQAVNPQESDMNKIMRPQPPGIEQMMQRGNSV